MRIHQTSQLAQLGQIVELNSILVKNAEVDEAAGCAGYAE